MIRQSYDTDLTDGQWQILEPLIPAAKSGGRPRSTDTREVLNAIFYLLRTGCAWRLLPHDFPKWQTVYTYFRGWEADGTWEAMNTALREQLRTPGRTQSSALSRLCGLAVRQNRWGCSREWL